MSINVQRRSHVATGSQLLPDQHFRCSALTSYLEGRKGDNRSVAEANVSSLLKGELVPSQCSNRQIDGLVMKI